MRVSGCRFGHARRKAPWRGVRFAARSCQVPCLSPACADLRPGCGAGTFMPATCADAAVWKRCCEKGSCWSRFSPARGAPRHNGATRTDGATASARAASGSSVARGRAPASAAAPACDELITHVDREADRLEKAAPRGAAGAASAARRASLARDITGRGRGAVDCRHCQLSVASSGTVSHRVLPSLRKRSSAAAAASGTAAQQQRSAARISSCAPAASRALGAHGGACGHALRAAALPVPRLRVRRAHARRRDAPPRTG